MFTFGLTSVAFWAADAAEPSDGRPSGMPPDLDDVVPSSGDQYRDWFTRMCLYMVLKDREGAADSHGDTVVIGTEYGNTEAMASLLREARTPGRVLSAQRFPNAITGSASAFVNMSIGATGRNMTLTAGRLTPVLAMWQCLRSLSSGQSARSHLLIGDVYSPEALTDATSDGTGSPCRSAMMHAVFASGRQFAADFDFSPSSSDVDPGMFKPLERNAAPATAQFLRVVQTLDAFGEALFECQGPSRRRASVTVVRAVAAHGSASAPSQAAAL